MGLLAHPDWPTVKQQGEKKYYFTTLYKRVVCTGDFYIVEFVTQRVRKIMQVLTRKFLNKTTILNNWFLNQISKRLNEKKLVSL